MNSAGEHGWMKSSDSEGAPSDSEGDQRPKSSRALSYAADPEFSDPAFVEDGVLFQSLEPDDGKLPSSRILKILEKQGLQRSDRRLMKEFEFLSKEEYLDINSFSDITNNTLIDAALRGDLSVPNFEAISDAIRQVFEEVKQEKGGSVADYIPQLSKVDPALFGVAVCTIDGQIFEFGDSRVPFCIQSTSKPMTYCMALEEHGVDYVHKFVGMEPSGRNFNELALDYKKRPHNPLINAGAIMTSSLVKRMASMADRFEYAMSTWRRLTGGLSAVTFANSTYLSELATADRNFCLAYLMREAKRFPDDTDIRKALEYYFMLCSIETDALGLAVASATLANGGLCPLTVDKVFDTATVQNTLSLMLTCGMYDFSGEWAFRVGVPAKSGVSGAIMAVIPGQMGICVYSPALDSLGNSVRGVKFLSRLSRMYPMHIYEHLRTRGECLDGKFVARPSESEPHYGDDENECALTRYNYNLNSLLYSAAKGDLRMVRRILARGCPVNGSDYDRRTALHLAVCESHMPVVEYLLAKGADTGFVDRFGHTPIDDAKEQASVKGSDLAEKILVLMTESSNRKPALISRMSTSLLCNMSSENEAKAVALSLSGINGMIGIGYVEQELEIAGVELETAVGAKVKQESWPSRDSHLSVENFVNLMQHDKRTIITRALQGSMVVPDFENMCNQVTMAYNEVQAIKHGMVTDYIPQLRNVHEDAFCVSICTVDGQRCDFGVGCTEPVSMQAVSSVLAYAEALQMYGQSKVHSMIGREPSGRGGSELVLNNQKKPHNPLINCGHLTLSAMYRPDEGLDQRFDSVSKAWSKASGGERVGFNNAVFLSEVDVADRNYCLSYLLREAGVISSAVDLNTNLKFYLQQHALEMSPRSLAAVGGTLANGGVCPLTGERLYSTSVVRNVLSMMFTCGMADTSGEIAFTAGIPIKDSWSGVCLAVIPNVMGVCVYSPKLDANRTSVRGVELLKRVSKLFQAHVFGHLPGMVDGSQADRCGVEIRKDQALRDEFCQLVYAAQHGDVKRIQRGLHLGVRVDTVDYDKRSMLHIASSDGTSNVVGYLIHMGADINLRDRWGDTALDCAEKTNQKTCIKLLRKAADKLTQVPSASKLSPKHKRRISSLEVFDTRSLKRYHQDPLSPARLLPKTYP